MTKYERAAQIWPLLICAARERKSPYTYEDIASIVGGAPRRIGIDLDPILKYCEDKGYAELTILVVEKETGKPSLRSGMKEGNEKERMEKVYQEKWFRIKQPQISDFEKY